MRYTLTFVEEDYQQLTSHLGSKPRVEQAAYLLCRPILMPDEVRLLIREVLPVEGESLLDASSHHMKIGSASYVRAFKRANDAKLCFVFVHSHPPGHPDHSPQDDAEEAKLFRSAYVRIRTPGVHGSLVFMDGELSSARVWLEDGTSSAIERVRIVGRRFRFWFPPQLDFEVPEFFERQVRAFGKDAQRLLSRLTVGVVGVGGTGSCVAEQLVRLGVGSILISDGEAFEASNVNRVYGSRVIDDGIPKVKLTQRLAADIGLGTHVALETRPITFRSALERFRSCDVIFGCTDDEWGRSLLTRLAIYYQIPVFDMGVKIDAEDGRIRSIQGRVTSLLPGTSCLYCRGRISAERIRAESIWAVNPEEAAELEEEGYIPNLGERAPVVVPFTTTIAATAITEFLHRLTGFLGDDRETSEVVHLIDDTAVRRNRVPSHPECFCADRKFWGRGDVTPFLDLTWRPE